MVGKKPLPMLKLSTRRRGSIPLLTKCHLYENRPFIACKSLALIMGEGQSLP